MEVDEDRGICLPPGFRFHPMDEEIITHYLWQKVVDSRFSATAIGEVDLNKCEPWDLPDKAKMGEKEWYFFCHRDRKYPTGMRTNRATEAGYWKATGKDKEILKGKDNNLVGMKKTLVFYKGRAPRGEKTNWVMHEYRLEGKSSYQNLPPNAKDEWVVCRVFHKNTEIKRSSDGFSAFSINSVFVDELLDLPTLPPLMEAPQENEMFNFNDPLTNFNSFNTTLAPNSSFYTQILPEASLIPNYHHGRSNCRNEEDYSYQSTLQQSASQETMISSEKNQEISSLGLMEVGFNQYYDDIDNLWK